MKRYQKHEPLDALRATRRLLEDAETQREYREAVQALLATGNGVRVLPQAQGPARIEGKRIKYGY